MGIFTEGNFIYPTKKDDNKNPLPVIVTIVGEMTRVKSAVEQMNYKSQKTGDQGYYDVLPVVNEAGEEKDLKISTWAVYFALRELNPDEGDTIKIENPSKGEYIITKV